MHYKELCERIYRRWRDDPREFADFDSDFNVLSLPEPYYPLSEGDKPLIVLNNNPGSVLDFQAHKWIVDKFSDSVSYAEVARFLMAEYGRHDRVISSAANARNQRIKEIAAALGHDSVENVEMFYLHSSGFNKKAFLRTHVTHRDIVVYHEALRAYLAERAVVIVAAVASGVTLSKQIINDSEWLRLQASIAGLDIGAATLIPVTEKAGKVTSGVLRSGHKSLVCMMGSNNLPKEVVAAIGS